MLLSSRSQTSGCSKRVDQREPTRNIHCTPIFFFRQWLINSNPLFFWRIPFFLSVLKKYKNSLCFLGTWHFRFTGAFSEESSACKGTCWKGEEPVEHDKKGSSRCFIAAAPFLCGKFHGRGISYHKLIRNIFQFDIKIESVQSCYKIWMTASAKSADSSGGFWPA